MTAILDLLAQPHNYMPYIHIGVMMDLYNVSVLKKEEKGNSSSITNNRLISLLNKFSKVSMLVAHAHMSCSFKHKLNPSQTWLFKSQSTTTTG